MGIAQDIQDKIDQEIKDGIRGTCPVCGRIYMLYRISARSGAGKAMRNHRRDSWSGTFLKTERCPGSYLPPKEAKP